MTNDLDRELTPDETRTLLSKFKDLNLADHYNFEGVITTPLNNADLIANFLKENRPITFTINESNVLYYHVVGKSELEVFSIDVNNSFAKSDSWLYSKLITVPSVFPTLAEGSTSNEMSSFYICLVIASVFGGAFEEDFTDLVKIYDFEKWCATGDDCNTMTDLLTSWIQLGSKYVKMVASAARYALVRERQKKRAPSVLLTPLGLDLEYDRMLREVSSVRFEYDNIILNQNARENMSKFEIKLRIAERDSRVQKILQKDRKMYQIWRLMHMNTNNIPPNFLLEINRNAKKNALELYQNIRSCSGGPVSREDKLSVKIFEKKGKDIVKRAYLNKLFAAEVVKFIENPDNYTAPNFV